VAGAGEKSPKDEPNSKRIRIIDCDLRTLTKATDGSFSNTGRNIDDIPPGKHDVGEIYMHH